jgi:hypothetical protein
MKNKIILLLAISILLQSCYSYKTIKMNEKNLVVGKTYKIQQNTKFEKVKLQSINDSCLVVKKGNEIKTVVKTDIVLIKEREYSTTKTLLLVTPIGICTAALGALAYAFRGLH